MKTINHKQVNDFLIQNNNFNVYDSVPEKLRFEKIDLSIHSIYELNSPFLISSQSVVLTLPEARKNSVEIYKIEF